MDNDIVLPWGMDYCKCGNVKRQTIDKYCVSCRKIYVDRVRKIKKLTKNGT